MKEKLLNDFDVSTLDAMETMWYEKFTKDGLPKAEALQVIINTVEGDYSQLSPDLFALATAFDEL